MQAAHNFFGFKGSQVNYDDFYSDQVGRNLLRWAGLLPAVATDPTAGR